MVRIATLLLCLPLFACAQAQDQASLQFAEAKSLIEKNCATCSNPSKEELEKGIDLATKAREGGYRDRAAVLRLLADAYGTLGAVLDLNDPLRSEALERNEEFLRELMQERPTDAGVRYEHAHRVIGKTETMLQDIDERIAEYRIVLQLDPKHEKARFDLAQDLFRKGEDEESSLILRSLLNSGDSDLAKRAAERLASFELQRASSAQIVRPAHFTGEVSKGQDFAHEFGELVFRLTAERDPATPGWFIQITPKGSTTDYSAVLTGPFHGMNPRYLSLSYGRTAKDVVESKGAGFRFVIDEAGYGRASAALEVMLGHTSVEGDWQEAFDKASKSLDTAPFCVGFLRLIDSRLTPAAEANVQAIDWLKFEVDLCTKVRY